MELIKPQQFRVLANPGVQSEQLLSPHNSSSERLTITRVTVEPGVTQPAHVHGSSEQVWVAFNGTGTLLLADGQHQQFEQGDVARFPDGVLHGLCNSGSSPFIYMSITSPPINFAYAYRTAT